MNDAYASRKQRANTGSAYPLALVVVAFGDGRADEYYIKNLQTGVRGFRTTTKHAALSSYLWAAGARQARI